MCEQVNINVSETNVTINIVSSEIQEVIDINVFETTEDVTLNITEQLIQVNINKVTGGGGEQTLAETLVFGNNTGGTDILLNNDDKIQLENNSSIRKGTYDFGQNGGVSRICGVDYEDMWQGGIRHVFDNNGYIRNSTNCFNIVPDSSFDVTLRFKVGSIWTLDDGTNYICTDATEGAAVWELYNVIPDVTGFVPYTGATQNVDLGEYELKAGQLTLDVSPTGTAAVGTTRWNDTIGSSETTLKGGTVVLKNGVDLVARVVNKVTPNATLLRANYTAVRISGAQGQRLAIAYAQANNDNNSADTIGLVCENIDTNQEGFIMTVGQFEEINTTGSLQGETWVDGDVLYLSPTTAGQLTNIKPTGITGHIVVMGYVEYAHAVHGKIYVKIMNGWELDELHNVYINSPVNNEGLFYDSADAVWKNKTIATALGYTPQNADLFTRLRNGWEASTDFLSVALNDGWTQRASGVGATTSSGNYASGNKAGILRATTGTTATGFAGPEFSSPNAGGGFGIGNGELTFENLIMMPILSDATQRFHISCGIFFGINFNNPQNAIFFSYDEGGALPSASPNWKCYTSASGPTRTLTTSSVVVNANQWYKLKCVINAAATSVAFYIDGVLVATHTTNIPSLTVGYALSISIIKTAGLTARTMEMDYSAIAQTLTTPR